MTAQRLKHNRQIASIVSLSVDQIAPAAPVPREMTSIADVFHFVSLNLMERDMFFVLVIPIKVINPHRLPPVT